MGPAELFAEIGGMLGLLLGWSILGMCIKSKVQCYFNIVL
jgi:hypothetical protein